MGTNPSTFTGSYDAAGNLVTETFPNGLTATTHYDESSQPRRLSYAKDGTTWLTFTAADERRRLSPIPDAWELADETSLRAFLKTADKIAGKDANLAP